jgi:hypothetical protein
LDFTAVPLLYVLLTAQPAAEPRVSVATHHQKERLDDRD